MNQDFVRYFSFAASEFADEEWFYIVERIARHEGKIHEQVSKEIREHTEERIVRGDPHPFQSWGSLQLLKRIEASQHIEIDE